jgi:choice-of-anchor B domain-containing protein
MIIPKTWYCLLLFQFLTFHLYAQNYGLVLQSQINFDHITNENSSNVWGFSKNGREYAIVGTRDGTTIVDLTIPTNPVELFHIDGNNSIWREPKVWNNYAYVVTEGGGGLLIINLNNLPNSAPHTFWTGGTLPNGSSYSFNTGHDLFTDNNGYLYLTGSNTYNGLVILNLNANPTNPPIVGTWNQQYVHDGFARNDTVWTANINDGVFRVFNASNKNNLVTLASQATTDNFTHNTALSDNGHYLFTTDESTNGGIDSYNVTDLSDIQRLDHFATTQGTVHNCYFDNNFLVCSYYQAGVKVFDVTHPELIVEVASYDTSPNYSGLGYEGCWGVYPYLPSGMILASDQQEGLYILQPTYQHACFLDGFITNASSGAAVGGASIQIVGQNTVSSDPTGDFLTAIATAGTYTIIISKSGYEPQTITVSLTNGNTQTINVALQPTTPFVATGQVLRAGTNTPIANANVLLFDGQTSYTATTNVNGSFSINLLGAGNYNIYAGKWGFVTNALLSQIISTTSNNVTISLQQGYYDDFLFNFNWTETHTASSGIWTRGEPNGTVSGGYPANPDVDVSNDYGDQCYVTGNSASGNAADDDIDNGNSILTSPTFDLSAYGDAQLNFSFWFRYTGGNSTPDDHTYIRLSNGIATVLLEDVVEGTADEAEWSNRSFNVADYLTPTANMHLIIDASDTGNGHLIEVAIDHFYVTDNNPPVTTFVVKAKAILEGAYNTTNNQMRNTLQTSNLLPLQQPYNVAPWNYAGTEQIANSNAFPANTVDWVLLELRNSSGIVVARRAALLRTDGMIMELNGTEGVNFAPTLSGSGSYIMIVRHRNHLALSSKSVVALPNTTAYDFSNVSNILGGVSQVNLLGTTNFYAMASGDANANGIINFADYNVAIVQSNGYVSGDFDMNGTMSGTDFAKFQPNARKIGVMSVRY